MGDPSLKRNGISFSVSVFNIQSVYRVMVCDGLDQASEVPLGTALFTQATKKTSPQKALTITVHGSKAPKKFVDKNYLQKNYC